MSRAHMGHEKGECCGHENGPSSRWLSHAGWLDPTARRAGGPQAPAEQVGLRPGPSNA